jgi:c-di-GMP-binding flagellar brake protein YcgR
MLAPLPGQKMAPVANGARYGVQGFTGQYDFQFETQAVGTFDAPFVYALLAWPEAVQARLVRQALRVRTLLPAQLSPVTMKGETQAASVLDLSASGALVETLHPMGDVGDTLRISFVVDADGEKTQITTEAVICHRRAMEAPSRERLGLSFRALPKTERLVLSIYLKDIADTLDAA